MEIGKSNKHTILKVYFETLAQNCSLCKFFFKAHSVTFGHPKNNLKFFDMSKNTLKSLDTLKIFLGICGKIDI